MNLLKTLPLLCAVLLAPQALCATEPAEERWLIDGSQIEVSGRSHRFDYHVLARSGGYYGDRTFGEVVDRNGRSIIYRDGSPMISNSVDFTSILHNDSGIYAITHFESFPSVLYKSRLKQYDDGRLEVIDTEPVDFSRLGGTMNNCAGSRTPWNSHLGSEEIAIDARTAKMDAIDDDLTVLKRYFGDAVDAINPYHYGWVPELFLNPDGSLKVVKHYAMGNAAHEMSHVMPDLRTVYGQDDLTNGIFTMFLADNARDLSSGTLYAARWHQKSETAAGIEWIELGHASDAEIEPWLGYRGGKALKFDDIFDTAEGNPGAGTCPAEFSAVNTTFGFECLKLRPGMAKAAAFLETRRFATLKGATVEFRKLEGITHHQRANRLFMSVSYQENGMEDAARYGVPDTRYDIGNPNDIRLPYNPCGAVYELDLAQTPLSDYTVSGFRLLIAGTPTEEDALNRCALDNIANPDNLTIMGDTLFIAEDTDRHFRAAVWAYNLNSGTLKRVGQMPVGSEATGLYYIPDLNGFDYMMLQVQHPYDRSFLQGEAPENYRATVGYFGPFPADR